MHSLSDSGNASAGPWRPVFVGGTGRSGTTIAGRLIDAFPGISLTPQREVRFISGTNGLADVYDTLTVGHTPDGRTATPERFVKNLKGPWFRRERLSGLVGGLHLSIEKPQLRVAAEQYSDEVRADPEGASRRLTQAILGPKEEGEPRRWVDTTPKNARRADTLLRMFPDARVLHMTRDGRDVAVSFAAQHFGPGDAISGIDAWYDRMSRALTCEALTPAGTVWRLPLTALARDFRQESLGKLATFLDEPLVDAVVDWFEANVSPDAVHEGRWRSDVSPDLAHELDARYQSHLASLDARWPNPLGHRYTTASRLTVPANSVTRNTLIDVADEVGPPT